VDFHIFVTVLHNSGSRFKIIKSYDVFIFDHCAERRHFNSEKIFKFQMDVFWDTASCNAVGINKNVG
jgi:hypothetical protein